MIASPPRDSDNFHAKASFLGCNCNFSQCSTDFTRIQRMLAVEGESDRSHSRFINITLLFHPAYRVNADVSTIKPLDTTTRCKFHKSCDAFGKTLVVRILYDSSRGFLVYASLHELDFVRSHEFSPPGCLRQSFSIDLFHHTEAKGSRTGHTAYLRKRVLQRARSYLIKLGDLMRCMSLCRGSLAFLMTHCSKPNSTEFVIKSTPLLQRIFSKCFSPTARQPGFAVTETVVVCE